MRHIYPEQAQVVRNIFTWFCDERVSMGGIINRLASKGIPSPSGKLYWDKAGLLGLLKTKAYIGKTSIKWKATGEIIELPDATPRIISDELFSKASRQLCRNRELARRNAKRLYLLSGYVYCKQCGRRYSALMRRARGKVTFGYRCGKAFEPNPSLRCHNRSWKAEILNDIVWREVEQVLSKPEVVLGGLSAVNDNTDQESILISELALVDKRLRELDKEQQQLLQWALKGFPEETVVAENKRINNARAELNRRRDELKGQVEAAKEVRVNIQSIKQACELVRNNLGELSLANKRMALETLKVKVLVDGEATTIEGCIPVNEGAIATTRLLRRLSPAHRLSL